MRLDLYIRVSRVGARGGESFISPKVQRERCEAIATAGGHTVAKVHTDLDQPGSKSERPGFQAALARVEAGQTGGIVVAKLDRFARSVADAAAALQRISDADGVLISAAETLDTSTPFGRFAMHMMLAMAELELDRIREGWLAARSAAVARGVHVASRTPTGYTRGEGKRLVPSDDAPAVAEVFRARARGASWAELGGILEQAEVRTPYGAENWTGRSLSHLISNRVYLGEARSGEFVLPDAHEPLVDVGIWQAAQRPRSVRSASGTTLLAGLLRCAGCRYVMKPGKVRDRKGRLVRQYHCRGKRPAGDCGARAAVLGSVIEPWVVEQVRAEVGDRVQSPAGLDLAEETDAAEVAMLGAQGELTAYLEADIAATVGAVEFRRGVERRQAKVDEASAVLLDLREQAAAVGGTVGLWEIWDELDVSARHQLLSAGIAAIFLRRAGQANVPVSSRALILWHGEAPSDLPGPGRRVDAIRPFEWPTA